MSKDRLYHVTLLSSATINDKKVLDIYGKTILEFLEKNIPNNSKVIIGNLKNGELIKFLKENKIEIDVQRQHPNSMGSSNRRYMKESDITLFLHHNNSDNINGFIEYVKNLDDKSYHILELKD